MKVNRRSLMFRFASKLLKYYLLGLFGFTLTCVLAAIVGAFPVVELLLNPFVGELLLRLAFLTICFIATAIVVESMR